MGPLWPLGVESGFCGRGYGSCLCGEFSVEMEARPSSTPGRTQMTGGRAVTSSEAVGAVSPPCTLRAAASPRPPATGGSSSSVQVPSSAPGPESQLCPLLLLSIRQGPGRQASPRSSPQPRDHMRKDGPLGASL